VRSKTALLLTLFIFTNLCLASESHRKTDTIVLYNGDTVTGEIKNMFAGILELKTNAMGTLKIEWQEIAKLESKYHYEVRLDDGQRIYGEIKESSRPGEVRVSDIYGTHDLSSLEVVEVRPVSIVLKDQIDVYISAGYSYSNASSVGQISLNTDISYETEKTQNQLTARAALTDTEEATTRSAKIDLSRNLWREKGKDSYRIVLGSYETNDELGLDHRYSVGTGLGRYLLTSQRSTWNGEIALQVITEQSFQGETQQNVEGIFRTGFSTWQYKTPELQLKFNGSIYPSITQDGRVRADTDVVLKWEIIEDLFLDITAFGSYDNRAADDSRFDYGITTGVGWTY
jgi:hypothetical protein